jgi:hypothetical protein
MYVRTHARMHAWMYAWMDGLYVCMDGCMDVCMHVCRYAYSPSFAFVLVASSVSEFVQTQPGTWITYDIPIKTSNYLKLITLEESPFTNFDVFEETNRDVPAILSETHRNASVASEGSLQGNPARNVPRKPWFDTISIGTFMKINI